MKFRPVGILIIILAFTIIFNIISCGGGSHEEEDEEVETSPNRVATNDPDNFFYAQNYFEKAHDFQLEPKIAIYDSNLNYDTLGKEYFGTYKKYNYNYQQKSFELKSKQPDEISMLHGMQTSSIIAGKYGVADNAEFSFFNASSSEKIENISREEYDDIYSALLEKVSSEKYDVLSTSVNFQIKIPATQTPEAFLESYKKLYPKTYSLWEKIGKNNETLIVYALSNFGYFDAHAELFRHMESLRDQILLVDGVYSNIHKDGTDTLKGLYSRWSQSQCFLINKAANIDQSSFALGASCIVAPGEFTVPYHESEHENIHSKWQNYSPDRTNNISFGNSFAAPFVAGIASRIVKDCKVYRYKYSHDSGTLSCPGIAKKAIFETSFTVNSILNDTWKNSREKEAGNSSCDINNYVETINDNYVISSRALDYLKKGTCLFEIKAIEEQKEWVPNLNASFSSSRYLYFL